MSVLRVALCQMNSTVGDLIGNVQKMMDMTKEAESKRARLILFPELAITGYPPQDLLKHPKFNKDAEDVEKKYLRFLRERAQRDHRNSIVVFGNVLRQDLGLYNSAKIAVDGVSIGDQRKCELPNYGVFDEKRYFMSGSSQMTKVFSSRNLTFGAVVCEDIWLPENRRLRDFITNGVQLVAAINASPFYAGKPEFLETMLKARASDYMTFVLYCNMVGDQDDLVFHGGSMVIGPTGNLISRGNLFAEEIVYADLNLDDVERVRLSDTRFHQREKKEVEKVPFSFYFSSQEQMRAETSGVIAYCPNLTAQKYWAAVTMVRDYFAKTGFTKAVIGASGGADSSLCAAIACDALGPENVHLILMPSKYSSEGSVTDARQLAKNLQTSHEVIPIQSVVNSFKGVFLDSSLGEIAGTVTEENLQARIRGTILMAYSNKTGALVLTTGNKSEIYMGYFTLYGDSVGGFNPLRDFTKTVVYELIDYRNSMELERNNRVLIPQVIIEKPPSAELKPNQKDTDSLPEYRAVLDPLIEMLVEQRMTWDEVVSTGACEKFGITPKVVQEVARKIRDTEYKRKQTPIGTKTTPLAPGYDYRMPIINKYEPITNYEM